MSRSRQTLLSRLTFGAMVVGSLTFGGVQALPGAGRAAQTDPYVCVTKPYDPGCAAYCLTLAPDMGGAHFCGRSVPGGYMCVCALQ